MGKIYGDIPAEFRHNCILSLEDGCFLYSIESAKSETKLTVGNTSFFGVPLKNSIIHRDDNKHIYYFISILKDYVENMVGHIFPIAEYLGLTGEETRDGLESFFDENKEVIINNCRTNAKNN